MEPTPAARPRGRADVVFRSLGDEWVLFDPLTGRLHVLNHTAALVWSLCDGELDADGVVGALRDLVEDAPDEDVLRAHVRQTLERFTGEGLLA